MQSIAYIDAPRQDQTSLLAQTARQVSLRKLGVVLVSCTLWATMIGGVVLALR
jgi:hypothetical protein